MFTKEQENWLSHLSKEKIVEILPYNPKCFLLQELKKEFMAH